MNFKFGFFLFLLILLAEVHCFSQSSNKPNIVFFFVDDMGWQDTSVPFYKEVTKLNREYYTPNMEILASEGMKFTQAYAAAVCSPSRVSLITGMNPARHRVTNWTLRKGKSPDPEHPIVTSPNWNLNGLSANPNEELAVYHVTLPELLKKEGYKTIHVGKAHFGADQTSGEEPLNLGFDVNIAGHAAGAPGSYYSEKHFSSIWRKGDKIWDVPGLEKYFDQDIFLTEALTLEANQEIENAVKEGKPFYLYMSHYAVHAPWEKDPRYYQKFIDQGLDEFQAAYASMLEGMDKSLGDIMAQLKKLGVDDNTIVVFMSDNGSPSQTPPNLPLRGHKIDPYEGGIRVPMIVKWPDVVPKKSETNDYVIIEDIFPTFLEMAGTPKPEKNSEDGKSFVSILEGKKTNSERPLFWHFPNTYDVPPYSIIRKGDWKLIYQHVDQTFELYNIPNDISETQNLISKNPKKAKELAKELGKYLKKTQAQMPSINATGESVPYPDEVEIK